MTRIFPGYSVVKKVKLWAKLSDKFPNWPCIGFIRQPVADQKIGMDELKLEKKLYVIPCGKINKYTSPYFHGVWLDTSRLEPFMRNYEHRKARGLEHQQRFFTEEFTVALEDCEANAEAGIINFRFNGSFEEVTYRQFRTEMLGDEKKDELLSITDSTKKSEKKTKGSKHTSTAATTNTVMVPSMPFLAHIDHRRAVRLIVADESICQYITHYYHHLGQVASKLAGESSAGSSTTGPFTTVDENLSRLELSTFSSLLHADSLSLHGNRPVNREEVKLECTPEEITAGRSRKCRRSQRLDLTSLASMPLRSDQVPLIYPNAQIPPTPKLAVTPNTTTPASKSTKRKRVAQ